MARLLSCYEDVKQARGVIDFEDVLLLTVGILEEHDDIVRTVQGQYRQFVVDEYQDVNALQQRLLDLWLGERTDVTVVGDPAQTIYSFTGASPRNCLRQWSIACFISFSAQSAVFEFIGRPDGFTLRNASMNASSIGP